MSKRARNDRGESQSVYAADDTYLVKPLDVVEPGHYLSGELPQKLHEEIGAMDGWSLVEYTPPSKKKDGDS
jgi:hypothetical protein